VTATISTDKCQKIHITHTDVLLQSLDGCQKTSSASLMHYGYPRTKMSGHSTAITVFADYFSPSSKKVE
jgi:hypothetical protein